MKKYFSTRVFLTFVFVVICFNGVASQAVNRDERKTVDIAERAVITSLNTVENAVGKVMLHTMWFLPLHKISLSSYKLCLCLLLDRL